LLEAAFAADALRLNHEISWPPRNPVASKASAIRRQLVASARFSVQARLVQCVAIVLRRLSLRRHMVSFAGKTVVTLIPRDARQIAIPESNKQLAVG
jgi:hypothetical protein